jgi:hypothetical protein
VAHHGGWKYVYFLLKSLKRRNSVIPAEAGIQLSQILKNSLDSGFHWSDDFLQEQNAY